MRLTRRHAALFGVALMGALGLTRLARHALSEPVERNVFVKHSDLLLIQVTDKLRLFAKEHKDLASHDNLVNSVRKAGLEGHWLALRFRDELSNGTITETNVICRPDDPTQSFRFPLIKNALDMLAGDAGPEVRIVPESLLKEDPASILGDLEEARK